MRTGITLFLTFLLALAISSDVFGQDKTVWDGVYAATQAATGKEIYSQYCASCHSVDLGGGTNEGAPPLAGEKFMENWREDNLESLYTKIRTTMPRRNPKNLSEQETIDLISYILQENAFPAGHELTTDALESTGIELKDGPRPLPNYAIIQIVGCMAQDGANWTLTKAGRPQRIRTSEKSSPEELKAAEKRPLGDRTFRLQNLMILGAFDPAEHVGQKMMAQGTLIRVSNMDRISVTELNTISPVCG